MKMKFFKLLIKLAWIFLPEGYSVKCWKWPDGLGNVHMTRCPKEKFDEFSPIWTMKGYTK